MTQPAIPTEATVDAHFGGKILSSLLTGTALGAGGMGLWHLARSLKKKREQAAAAEPDMLDAAATPASLAPKFAFDASTLQVPALGGAGIGALIGAIRAGKGKKLKGALSGGLTGGAVGAGAAALNSDEAREFVGKNLPRSLPWGSLIPDGEKYTARSSTQQAASDLGSIVAGGLGAYGGAKAVGSMLEKDDTEKHKDTVQSARDEYFNTLLNSEKSALNANFDVLYGLYEKNAGYIANDPARGPHDSNMLVNGWNNMGAGLQTLAGIAALGAGGVGAKYMYDKTKAQSNAKLRARAIAARERLKGMDSPWVDPQELAQIKALTANNGPVHEQGM